MIKVLFLAANPAGTTKLALDDEIRAIDEKLRGSEYRDRLDLVSHWAVRWNDLSGILMRQRPGIVHFSGHGAEKTGEIVLVGDGGTSRPVAHEALAGLFRVLKGNVRVVVLNACYTGSLAKAIVREIDCAIGMSDKIGDDAAIAFAAWFYEALGYGKSVQDAYELGVIRLIGEGVANAKGLVKLHKRPRVDPSKIILVGVQPEPPAHGKPMRRGMTTPVPVSFDDQIQAVLRPLMAKEKSARQNLSISYNVKELDGGGTIQVGGQDCFTGGCKIRLQLANTGSSKVIIDTLILVIKEYRPVPEGVSFRPDVSKMRFGQASVPQQLFLHLRANQCHGRWVISHEGRSEMRPIEGASRNLLEVNPPVVFVIDPGDAELIHGAVMVEQPGVYTFVFTVEYTPVGADRYSLNTQPVHVVRATA